MESYQWCEMVDKQRKTALIDQPTMYKGETCQSDAQESVISQTSGGLVLIGLKQNEI